jgi:hypothetical protein
MNLCRALLLSYVKRSINQAAPAADPGYLKKDRFLGDHRRIENEQKLLVIHKVADLLYPGKPFQGLYNRCRSPHSNQVAAPGHPVNAKVDLLHVDLLPQV